tara:strand:+ start:147686 stop:148984 length:1299 start_codon:yes stop_codon:yes gene_type:complete
MVNFRLHVKLIDIPFHLLFLLFFLIPFGTNLISKIIILLIISSLLFLKKKNWLNNFLLRKEYLIPSIAVYLLYSLGLLWSDNIPEALKKMEHGLSFLVFPLVLPLFDFSKKDILNLFKSFSFGCLFILISSFLYFLYVSITHDEYIILGEIRAGDRPGNVYEYLSKHFLLVEVHRTYFSAYLLICILFVINNFKEFSTIPFNKKNLVSILSILTFILGLICLQSKINIAILFLIFIYYTVKSFKKSPILLFKVILTFATILFLSKNIIINRLKPMVKEIENIISSENENEKKFTKVLQPGSTETRYMLYKSSLQLIGESPILGFGTGDLKDVLRNQNYKNNYKSIAHLNYGTHSQLLSMLVSFGLLGFFVFISFFLLPLYTSIKINDSFTSFILLVLFLNCLTESFLSRQEGIIPTVLFITALSFSKKNNSH